ncbi:MAG: hypothetical protein JO065_12440 [Acidobacteria bacterium]|nr:hypothetical protein [Acidobacteriota bacterium]
MPRAAASTHKHWMAWTIFALAMLLWCVLRGIYQLGSAYDLLIVIALAAQAWLLFLRKQT